MVARHVRDVEAGSSNLPTPTTKALVRMHLAGAFSRPGRGEGADGAEIAPAIGASDPAS